ncbi:MAG: hypothetical protein PHP96_02895 [Candidatus Dojkabacteria bacterium]|nr:hypothetical protein [Candidatus Dojkabacteria bacterium]MDD4561111.1 hypothetical protein [Candidatus Dojkabacteria bacterium]
MAEVKNFNTTSEITISDLFSKLDKYLIGDIEAILNARHEDGSGVGYPCLMTILSGMELLGFLLCGNKECAFTTSWNELEKTNKKYKSDPLRKVFRQTIRNGIAHNYLAKSGVYIHHSSTEKHLQRVRDNGVDGLCISCEQFFNDFFDIYEDIKEYLIKYPEKAYLDKLIEDLRSGQKYVDKYFDSISFKNIDTGITLTKKDIYGASGFGGENRNTIDSRYISA